MSTKRQREKWRKWARDCRIRGLFYAAVRSVDYKNLLNRGYLFGMDWGWGTDYSAGVMIPVERISQEPTTPSEEIRVTRRTFATLPRAWSDLPEAQRQLNETMRILQDRIHLVMLGDGREMPWKHRQ